MNKSNISNGERMAMIETKIDGMKEHLTLQSNTLKEIKIKIDCNIKETRETLEKKADKTEVINIKSRVDKITWTFVVAIISILLTVVGFLIKRILFGG
jgi:hypothetical protein